MKEKDKLHKILKFVQKHSKADDFEIYVSYNDTQDTRFAQNSITQHLAGDCIDVIYDCSIDKRVGTAHTKQIDEANLLRIIRRAEDAARQNIPDPDTPPSLAKEDYPQVSSYADSVKRLTSEKLVDIVKSCILNAQLKEAILSGIISKSIFQQYYATKNGFFGYETYSNVELSMTMRKDHIETKVAFSNKDFDKLNVDGMIHQLNEQFDALKNFKEMNFETLPVIMRPQAVMEFFQFLWWFFNRKSADEGLTPFTGQLGKKFLGSNFSLLSTIDDPDLSIFPFSSTCVHKNVNWVTNGTINEMPTQRDWAFKHNLTPSSMHNFIIPGQGISEGEMMKKVKRGLILNNLWYIRVNDEKTADLTGMTRDGVLYFENGKVQHAVNNFRFNECLHKLTERILATGVSTQVSGHAKIPTMLIDDFHFVDKTTF